MSQRRGSPSAGSLVPERTKESEWEVRHLTTELVVRIAKPTRPQAAAWTLARDALPLFGDASRFTLRQAIKRLVLRQGIPATCHRIRRVAIASQAMPSPMDFRCAMRWTRLGGKDGADAPGDLRAYRSARASDCR